MLKQPTLLLMFIVSALLCPGLCHGQTFQADTLKLQFGLKPENWGFSLHHDTYTGNLPSALLPIEVPAGMVVSGFQLLDCETAVINVDDDQDGVGNDFRISVQTFDQRKETVNKLLVHPFRRHNGNLEQLLAARLVIQFDSLVATAVTAAGTFVNNSVLSTGRWLKIAVVQSGVHRITPADIAAAGWNPAQIDPRRLALFGNGGMMLPERNSAFRYDDLTENPIVVTGEADGSFDTGDVIYFFGQGTTAWSYNQMTIRYDHRINYYSDTTYYFLTELSRPGLRIGTKPEATANPNTIADIFLDYGLYENDLENLIHSGREWYGEYFNRQKDVLNMRFHFPNRIVQRPVMINTQLAVRSLTETIAFSLELNGQTALAQQAFLPISAGAAAFAREQAYNITMPLAQNDSLNFVMRYHAEQDNSKGWIDFLRVNAWRQLSYVPGMQLLFRNPEAVGFNVVAQYRISQTTPGLWLWDVTNPIRPVAQMHNTDGNLLRFNVVGDSIREYVLFNPSDAFLVARIQPIPNQNLHSIQVADMIIVAPPQFRTHAEAMAALHLQHDGMESVVACINEIYNEFGSGKPDVTALRDFIRMVYLRNSERLKYVLLFGDASFDYKNRIPNNTNLIPTYQSVQSIIETQSFVSDDYFGLMGSTEGQDMQGVLDLGIGRFPVSTQEEAGLMVEKNFRYLSALESHRGPWQNYITFMADDGDGNLHMSQAETLAMRVDTAYQNFNIRKIYLDAFRRVAVPGGFRYPDATAALLKAINDGSLIVNYTGHGGVSGLTDEKVFSITEIEGLRNRDRMAFFITATCEFSRFDNPGLVSAGERLLLNPTGGAIALMTTTRLAFAHSNFNVNLRLYASLMTEGKSDINRLGDIIRLSKNPTNSYIYNFVLLGNPALRLSYPEYRVEVISVNGQSSDTLHAMSEVHIEGRIVLPNGQLASGFNGVVQVLMFDKKTTYRTLGNDAFSVPANFSLHDKMLFKGKATVKNGRFSIRYNLPRSISYNFGKPRISFFAADSAESLTAGGYFDNLVLGGTDPDITPDATGPDIVLSVNNTDFKDGGIVPENITITAHISDPQGIHFLGTEIGRDIVATHLMPDGTTSRSVLNTLFEPQLDNPAEGKLSINLTGLMQGSHRFTLRAWDLHNNSGEKTINFTVNPSETLAISNVVVWPNPLAEETRFVFSHNKPGQKLFTMLEIYDVLGNRVDQIQAEMKTPGTFSEPLRWDARNLPGGRLPSGVYLWRLIVQPEDGLSQTVSGRMILRSP
ncbi:MAG TPA: type IX secretion system sortase PorU [Bacteroidales bacterium]|nr:type IX secretion system sortase PorU [Bacteroidales bacterium]